MSVPYINRGIKHPCAQFTDNTPMPYADEPYCRKPPRIDEQFGVGQHDLDYQCVYIFFCYIYQNNWILLVVVIFQFV
jgi:hypothetical protein